MVSNLRSQVSNLRSLKSGAWAKTVEYENPPAQGLVLTNKQTLKKAGCAYLSPPFGAAFFLTVPP